jgi:hypothetical protein
VGPLRPSPGRHSLPLAALALATVGAAAAVYGAVWSHELGHALAARLAGCRAGWWPSGVTPWLAGSRPAGIDAACLAARGRGAVAGVALAGIAANLALLAAAALAARGPAGSNTDRRRRWGRTFRLFFLLLALANAAEALSYLVPNALWPRADMATAIAAAGLGRLPWLAAGLAATALAARALRVPMCEAAEALATPALPARAWRWGFLLYALAVAGAAMASRWAFG